MTKVYVIRHAEAEGNLYRRVHGHYDSNITETGHKQIEKLSERFKDIPIDAVYSSDLIRTQMTARAISVPKGLEIVTTPALREVDMGEWEDLTWGEVARRWPDSLMNFTSNPDKWEVPGSEKNSAVADRMMRKLKELAAKHDGESIALVTHGSASRTLFAAIMKKSSDRVMELGVSDNTAVSLLNVSGDNIEIQYLHDNSHLPDELSAFSRQKWHKSKNGDDGYNLRYEPMDIITGKDRYLEYRRDGWKAVHGTMNGYTDEYYDLALKHKSQHTMAVSEAFLNDKPAGLLELDVKSGEANRYGSIAFYYMCEKYRYRGFGVQLLGQAISIYRPMGRDWLRLHVAKENKSAISFYQKYGFETIGQTKGAIGQLYIMEKSISRKI